MPLPNFFIIGANKAGTTSLYRYLSHHPDVYMSPVKEPSYFKPAPAQPLSENYPARRVVRTYEDYAALFAAVQDETAVGEASTAYSGSDEAARRIREAVPEAKLVAILRHPAERAFSAYGMHVQWGVEDLSFADATALELDEPERTDTWRRHYVRQGFYGRFLSSYLELFDRDQLRIYLYDDLVHDRLRLARDLFEYLGVDPSFVPQTETRYNVTRHPPRYRALDRTLRLAPAQAVARRLLPQGVLTKTREFVKRRNRVVPEFPIAVRQRLIDQYRDDIALTEQITDRDLSTWLV